LAEQFKAQHPGTTFDIAAEGSATGFAALIDKTAAIGMASRPAKPEEIANGKAKGVDLKETIVAYDGIAVIVNTANSIKGLTKKQVEQIFTGEITDWECRWRQRRKDLSLYPEYIIGDVRRVQGVGDEEARLCSGFTEAGGE
jgi:ABC-type phosphate transport system substrate-binding protein